MTTIATDGPTMAADGLATEGSTATDFNLRKVWRLPDGSLVGAAGNYADCLALRRWLADGGERPHLSKGFAALVLKPGGDLDYYCEKLVPIPSEVPAAIGSGGRFALAVMDAGCTTARAVEIACRPDIGSGGAITVEALA